MDDAALTLTPEYMKEFFEIFGKPNEKKNNRLSWSGTPFPTYYLDITSFGQELKIDEEENIIILYHFSKDTRCFLCNTKI